MNYRHAFHAGNFADLVKHAALLEMLAGLRAAPGPLKVIDTHAGRGLYDLRGPEAVRSGEAEAGIARLVAASDAPPEFAPLRDAVAELNRGGDVRRYPGSPWLIARALRSGDSYLACELRPEEHRALRQTLKDRPGVEALCVDGFQIAAAQTPARGRVLVLIDPPFERPDDYARIVETVIDVRRRNAGAAVLIWLPLKDLATFDAFLGDLEDAVDAPILVAETRMRPLTDPMKMNGCALAVIGGTRDLAARLDTICTWTAARLGTAGSARVQTL